MPNTPNLLPNYRKILGCILLCGVGVVLFYLSERSRRISTALLPRYSVNKCYAHMRFSRRYRSSEWHCKKYRALLKMTLFNPLSTKILIIQFFNIIKKSEPNSSLFTHFTLNYFEDFFVVFFAFAGFFSSTFGSSVFTSSETTGSSTFSSFSLTSSVLVSSSFSSLGSSVFVDFKTQ